MKQKTLAYNFDIKYIKGLKNHANVFSRYPVNKPDEEDIADAESLNAFTVNSIVSSVESAMFVTWQTFKEHCETDEQYQTLFTKVRNKSFADSFTLEDPEVKEFYNVRDRLAIVDGSCTLTRQTNFGP